jgi:hypothetical protein
MQTAIMTHRHSGLVQSHQFSEYLLVAVPAPELHDKILFEQELFAVQYQGTVKSRANSRTKLQIEVAGFQAKEEMEPTLLRWMHRIFSAQQGFKVPISNYSGHPPNEVFLRVPEPGAFQVLGQALQPLNDYIKSCDCPAIKTNTKPNLPIAQKLDTDTYLKAMLDYSQRSFHEVFEVKELVLLRRKHQFDSYVQVNKFVLQPA